MRVFGAEPPPVQPPQGRRGKFRTHFSPVIASAAGQSSGSRSPEAAQAAARSQPSAANPVVAEHPLPDPAMPGVRSRPSRPLPPDGAPDPGDRCRCAASSRNATGSPSLSGASPDRSDCRTAARGTRAASPTAVPPPPLGHVGAMRSSNAPRGSGRSSVPKKISRRFLRSCSRLAEVNC